MPSKSYKVVGAAPVFDNAPGETFSASLDKGAEDFLVGIGALEVVKPSTNKDSKKDD